MGTTNGKDALGVLAALAALVLMDLVGVPCLLYLAFDTRVALLWYAAVAVFFSVCLVVYLLKDHDTPPQPPTRTIGRVS